VKNHPPGKGKNGVLKRGGIYKPSPGIFQSTQGQNKGVSGEDLRNGTKREQKRGTFLRFKKG